MDIITAQKVRWISDFFENTELVDKINTGLILPRLRKETVLMFLQEAFNRIQQGNASESWVMLYNEGINLALRNVDYMLNRMSSVLASIDKEIMRDFIKQGFYQYGHSETGTMEKLIYALINLQGF